MRKLLYNLCFAVAVFALFSCNNTETYADMKKKENAAISEFLARNTSVSQSVFNKPISVISETDFTNNGEKTDTAKNEFVLFESTGIYMQIVRKGPGEKVKNGETTVLLCRFNEYNILTDTLQLTNTDSRYSVSLIPEELSVTNSYGSFTGSFTSLYATAMTSAYGTAAPSGWLVPLRYINVGRQTSEDEEIAKVRIIVPSTQGHQYASASVYPCYYEITYQRKDSKEDKE